jgi:SAM-dependent methyltransferase
VVVDPMVSRGVPRRMLPGLAADGYERYRPGYPDEVVERTLRYAGRPVRSALEIEAGTGKATHAFASRGVAVTALEPDAEMCTVLRRETAGLDIVPVRATFESFRSEAGFDLLFSAAGWPVARSASLWARAAGLLRPGGTLALFGAPLRIADGRLRADADEAARSGGGGAEDGDGGQEGRPAPGAEQFTDAEQQVVRRQILLTAQEYVGYLSTLSTYARLAVWDREKLLRAVAEVLPAELLVDASVHLHLARRR